MRPCRCHTCSQREAEELQSSCGVRPFDPPFYRDTPPTPPPSASYKVYNVLFLIFSGNVETPFDADSPYKPYQLGPRGSSCPGSFNRDNGLCGEFSKLCQYCCAPRFFFSSKQEANRVQNVPQQLIAIGSPLNCKSCMVTRNLRHRTELGFLRTPDRLRRQGMLQRRDLG